MKMGKINETKSTYQAFGIEDTVLSSIQFRASSTLAYRRSSPPSSIPHSAWEWADWSVHCTPNRRTRFPCDLPQNSLRFPARVEIPRRRHLFLGWRGTATRRYRFAWTPEGRRAQMLSKPVSGEQIRPRSSLPLPFARRYSDRDKSSIDSSAASSSRAKACSSSYSPGRPMRSSIIRPRRVYLKKKKTARTMNAIAAEPKADKMPIRMPLPVEPESPPEATTRPVSYLSYLEVRLAMTL